MSGTSDPREEASNMAAVVNEATFDEQFVETLPVVEASGEIKSVTVHARGAVITRCVRVPDELPDGPFELKVPKVTPLAEPGSIRVKLPDASGRELVSVRSDLDVPGELSESGDTVERLRELERQRMQLEDEAGLLERRASQLRELTIEPESDDEAPAHSPAERIAAALELASVIDERIEALAERFSDVEAELAELYREREAMRMEDQQTSDAQRMGESHPSREILLHFGDGDGLPDTLSVSYVAMAARWWPTYRVDLSDGGRRAAVRIDALVAQATGEDWTSVPVALSTAELVYDARLPELASLRLGRAQQPRPRGFREPPGGTERLFESFDAAYGAQHRPAPAQPASGGADLGAAPDSLASALIPGQPTPAAPPPAAPPPAQPQVEAFAAEEVARQVDRPAPSRSARSRAPSSASFGGLGGGGVPSDSPQAPPPPEALPQAGQPLEPAEAWLRFDRLVLAGPSQPRRGTLRPRAERGAVSRPELSEAARRAQRADVVDPLASRGSFDYRYETEGRVEIPSDARLHRIEVCAASCDTALSWRTVPREEAAVYRLASLENPHDAPLLAGPVEVYAEGSLVTTTACERVGPGGTLRVGLGVDERIRVARNARVAEEGAGLFRGKREILHEVDIELRSGLGFAATVEVLDRVPVTHDDDVAVELIESTPEAESYDQSDEGRPIRGGLRWQLELPAGQEEQVSYSYHIRLRAKDEIVGGNRRE
jgi:hypothetical protein